MASYEELRILAADATLRNKVSVAVAVKAQVYIDGATPTADQLTWASDALKSPDGKASAIMNYVLASVRDLTVGQIAGATDATIQTKVDAAVDALVSGGIT